MDVLNHICDTCHEFDGGSVVCEVCRKKQCRECVYSYEREPVIKLCRDCFDKAVGFCHGCQVENGDSSMGICFMCEKLFCLDCVCKIGTAHAIWCCKQCIPTSDVFQDFVRRTYTPYDRWDQVVQAFVEEECQP